MTKEDYIFTKRMQAYIDNRFLDLLIEGYEKNLSMLERKKIKDYVESKGKPDNPLHLMFMYIMFNRTKPNSYLDEVGKYLVNAVDITNSSDLDKVYKEYKRELKRLDLRPPKVNKQVVLNIKYYMSQLDIPMSD